MQHNINPDLHGPRAEAMVNAIQSCVHCGFCLAACPTYQVMGEEMDSPRGRIYLMKEVLEGQLEATEAQPYIDRCLGCLGCVPACPSGVAYGDLLLGYRSLTEPRQKRSLSESVSRRMLVETLPHPQRFRMAATTGKAGKLVKGLLPAKMRGMLELLPKSLPPTQPLPALTPAKGKRRARVALLAGCVQTVLAPDINHATLRVLAENGVETVIPAGQGCCGSIMMHIGEEDQALKLARNNMAAFPQDVDAILTNAAGCGSGMKEYGLLFKGLPEEEAAEAFAGRVQDITEFLDKLGLTATPTLPSPLRVVYQDACHLNHAQGIQRAPRNLLAQVDNLTVLELSDGGLCCGSAGTYNLEQPEIAAELGRRKAGGILATGAAAVVSGNIGCMTQIETHLDRQGAGLPVYHTVQVLDMGY
jgi:glycolate oxidase iron-sulfur subunit